MFLLSLDECNLMTGLLAIPPGCIYVTLTVSVGLFNNVGLFLQIFSRLRQIGSQDLAVDNA